MGDSHTKTGADIQEALAAISRMELSIDDIAPILREWESRPTLTAKKIFGTTAFLMAVAAFIGIDYAQLPFMGMSEGRGTPRATLVPLAVLLLSGAIYWWQRGIDLKIRQWRSRRIEERIASIGKKLDFVRPLLTDVKETDFRELPYLDDRQLGHRVRYSSDPLDAFYFYQEEFSPRQASRHAMERFEMALLLGLALFGYGGLIDFWNLG